MYALIVIVILAPILYANDKNIPETITVAGLGYSLVEQNVVASRYEKTADAAFGEETAFDPSGKVKPETIVVNGDKVTFYDKTGKILTEILKRDAGFDLGFIFSQPFIDLDAPVTISKDEFDKFENNIAANPVDDGPVPLDRLIPPPATPGRFRNLLVYDKYKIRVPVIYTTFEDVFNTKPDGSIDWTTARDTAGVDSPVQVKLRDGIVHLAYSPQPGEIGNSYIVGHSSNYSFIKSAYNTVFKPIEQKSQPGEEFIIYDRYGRELKFKVFEAIKIADNDVETAYQPGKYTDRRVVTLQTSILGIRNGKWEATHRWLTRGELVLP
jgi:hypothetical protein